MWLDKRKKQQIDIETRNSVAFAFKQEVYYLHIQMLKFFQKLDSNEGSYYQDKLVPNPLWFTVYQANAGSIGLLPSDISGEIVAYYNEASNIIELMEENLKYIKSLNELQETFIASTNKAEQAIAEARAPFTKGRLEQIYKELITAKITYLGVHKKLTDRLNLLIG